MLIARNANIEEMISALFVNNEIDVSNKWEINICV